MDVIDDEGRLFGLVNVIDVLVVLLVAAVVIAGAVFVLSTDPAEAETRYATVDLGSQPGYIVDSIEDGDVMELEGNEDNLTVTDVFYGPGADGEAQVLVRVAVNGERVEVSEDRWQFQFGGEPFRGGQELTLAMLEYEVSGEVTDVSQDGATIGGERTEVFTTATVSSETADALAVGDAYTVNGHEVATVESLQLFPGEESEQVALMGLSLATHERGGTAYFGTQAVRVGSSVDIETGAYELSAQILERDTAALETETRSIVLETVVSDAVADRIEAGDSYRIGGQEIATVESVQGYPTAERDQKRLFVGLEIDTVVAGEERYFGGTELRDGAVLPFRTPGYSFDGEVVDPDGTDEPGTPDVREVTLKKTAVHPDRADRIEPGLTEEFMGEQLAELTAIERESATVVIESEDGNIYEREHPINQELTITAELQVRETATGLRFHGEEIREGDSLVLDVGRLLIEVELIEIGT